MAERSQSEFDLAALLTALRRRWWVIPLCAILGAAAALAYSLAQTKEYSATASLLFRDPGFDQSLFGQQAPQQTDPTRQAATNAELVSLRAVADRAAKALGGRVSAGQVHSDVRTAAQGESDIVSITATNSSPTRAADIANAYANAFVAFRRDADRKKLADSQNLVQREYNRLSPAETQGQEGTQLARQISRLGTLRSLQTGNAEVVQRAEVPSGASSPQVTRNAALGLAVGLILGFALALLLDRLDRRIVEPDELERAFALPILGTVPESDVLQRHESREAGDAGGPRSLPFVEAEAFRTLRTRLRYFNVDRDIRSVVITSAEAGEGKSTVSWNFAATAAAAGSRVLLLEADLHHPSFAKTHDLKPLPGLAEVLTGQSAFDDAVQRIPVSDRTNGEHSARELHVLVAGAAPPNPAELLESAEMDASLKRWSDTYDLVVIDTTPIALLADAIPLMKRATGVIVVGRVRQLTREDASHLSEQLRKMDAPVLGVVANRARRKGGYGYGYGYGNGDRG